MDNSPLHWRASRPAGQVQGQRGVATKTGGTDNDDKSESDVQNEDESDDGESVDNDDVGESDDYHEGRLLQAWGSLTQAS